MHINTHTQKPSKAYGSHMKHSYCRLMNQHWNACAPLKMLEPCAGKSSWGRASNPQEDCPALTERGSIAKWLGRLAGDEKVPGSNPRYATLVLLFP